MGSESKSTTTINNYFYIAMMIISIYMQGDYWSVKYTFHGPTTTTTFHGPCVKILEVIY